MTTPQKYIKQNTPWNQGILVGQKRPLKLKDIWTIRIRFEITEQTRDSVSAWIAERRLEDRDYLFPQPQPHEPPQLIIRPI